MAAVSRRSFIAGSGAGALGAAALTLSPGLADAHPVLSEQEAARTGPALVNIVDARKGKLELLIGEQTIPFTDKRLVARLLRAGK